MGIEGGQQSEVKGKGKREVMKILHIKFTNVSHFTAPIRHHITRQDTVFPHQLTVVQSQLHSSPSYHSTHHPPHHHTHLLVSFLNKQVELPLCHPKL